MTTHRLPRLRAVSIGVAPAAMFATGGAVAAERQLLNVSYDPTRELYQEFNALFAAHWKC